MGHPRETCLPKLRSKTREIGDGRVQDMESLSTHGHFEQTGLLAKFNKPPSFSFLTKTELLAKVVLLYDFFL